MFWKITDRTEAGDNGEAQEEEGRSTGKRFLARGYSVFNAAQVEGFEGHTGATSSPKSSSRKAGYGG